MLPPTKSTFIFNHSITFRRRCTSYRQYSRPHPSRSHPHACVVNSCTFQSLLGRAHAAVDSIMYAVYCLQCIRRCAPNTGGVLNKRGQRAGAQCTMQKILHQIKRPLKMAGILASWCCSPQSYNISTNWPLPTPSIFVCDGSSAASHYIFRSFLFPSIDSLRELIDSIRKSEPKLVLQLLKMGIVEQFWDHYFSCSGDAFRD